MRRGRGNGLGTSDWGELLSGPALSNLTELNGLAWSPERQGVVLSNLGRVARRRATSHLDLRSSQPLGREPRPLTDRLVAGSCGWGCGTGA